MKAILREHQRNVVNIIGVSGNRIVMELVPFGNLFTVVHQDKRTLEITAQREKIISGIATGMFHIHKVHFIPMFNLSLLANITHADLSSMNILVQIFYEGFLTQIAAG